MSAERRGPAVCSGSNKKGGKGEMTKAPISLQDLRRSLYVKAKAEPAWRFWGLYVHVCKMETLCEAYRMAKENDGAPGIDGITFEVIEESGAEGFLRQIREELITSTYRPMQARKKEIPRSVCENTVANSRSKGKWTLIMSVNAPHPYSAEMPTSGIC